MAAQAKMKAGFHRTRYSMSMSESAHKRNASDSEIQDLDADGTNIDELRKFSAADDIASKTAADSVISPAPNKPMTPAEDDIPYQPYDFGAIGDANNSQNTENNTSETKEETTDTTQTTEKDKNSKTKSTKGKEKGKSKKDSKGKTQRKKGNEKPKAKTAKTAAKTGKKQANASKTAKKAGKDGGKGGRTSGKGGKNKKTTKTHEKTASRSANNTKKGKKTGGNSTKTNKNGKNSHKRKVSISTKRNLKASNAKKIKDEKRRQSLQAGANKTKKSQNNNKTGTTNSKDSKNGKNGKNKNETTESADSKEESSNLEQPSIEKQSSTGSNGGREKKKRAWYLSGGKQVKQSSLGSKTRTWHEKKKDAQYNELLKEANAMQMQVFNSYHLYAPNMIRTRNGATNDATNDATSTEITESTDEITIENENENENDTNTNENENGDEKVDSTDNSENKNENLSNFDLTGKMETVDFGGIVIEACTEMLLTLDESWEGRLDIIEEICDQLIDCYNKCDYETYYLKFTKFVKPICHQFADWRSSTIIGLKERFSKLVQKTPQYFLPFAPLIIRSLYPDFAVKIEVLREASIDLGEIIVMSCHEYDSDHLILNVLLEGLKYKHDFTRSVSAEYLEYLVRQYPVLENGDGSFKDENLLNTIDQCIRLAVKDRALETRTNGYRALHIYEKISPTKAQEIISRFSKAVTRKYKDVISRKQSI